MAEILIRRVQFIASNPFGEFVAGDVVEVYYDPDNDTMAGGGTEGFTVYKNGVLAGSGADIHPFASFSTDVYIETRPTNQICNSGSKVDHFFVFQFPYSISIYFAGYPQCQINPPTCDIFLVGTPTVVSATGETEADGEILVTASSSNPIQYKNNADFVYGDGTAQSTGEFIGLIPGQYRIFIRDSTNCAANVLVTVSFSNTYSPFYRLEYDDPVGGVTRIDISKRDYAGSVTEVNGSNAPFIRNLNGAASQNKFESVLTTSVNVGLTSQENFYFQTLYTNSPEDFRVFFYKDLVLKGIYKVLPNQFAEDYKAPPYYTTITAIDGLASLKDFIFLQDDGLRFNGDMRVIELIAFILRKTKILINIRVAINLYATGMDTTDSDDPLYQALVDTDTYYINEAQPSLDYVLRQLLEPFGARLIQENAVWNIVCVEEMRGEYDYREFDPYGVYVLNGSFQPIIDIKPPDETNAFYFSDNDHFMTLCPGYGKIRVLYNMGLKPNILENGDFRLVPVYNALFNSYSFNIDTFGFNVINDDYPITTTWESIDEYRNVALVIYGDSNITAGYGNAYVQAALYFVRMGTNNTLKIAVRYKLPQPVAYGLFPISISIPYQKVRFRIKYGTLYLLSDGTWSSDENFITVYVDEFGKYIDSEFIATSPNTSAADGFDLDIRVYHSYIYHAEFTTSTDLKAKETYDGSDPVIPEGTRSEVSALGPLEYLYYYELENNTDSETIPAIVRPNDYHATNNPRQWILKGRVFKTMFTNFTSNFYIDFIKVNFLTNGSDPTDTILREVNAEARNSNLLEKTVTHGSYQSQITTLPQWDFGLGRLSQINPLTMSLVTSSVLSADLLYSGYFRNGDGDGYVTWARDGQPESTTLHEILLKMYAAQYNASWRKLTGTLYSDNMYFSFLNIIRVTNENDRLYMPISASIDDLNNRVNGEFLEFSDITQTGSGTSAFTRGFNQSGFR